MSSLDELEKELFDARESLVGHAEARGYGHLFSDKQSISDMREQILSVEDDEVRRLLLDEFKRVDELYSKYSAELVSEVASDEWRAR